MDGLLSPVGLGTPGAQHPGDTPRGMDGLLSPVRPGWWGGGPPNTNTNFAPPPPQPPQDFFLLLSTTLEPISAFRKTYCTACSRKSCRGAEKRRPHSTDDFFFARFYYYAGFHAPC